MSVGNIVLLLEYCLKNTYFSFQGQFFEQVEGVAMGSPVSPIVANVSMEYFVQNALSTASHPPSYGTGMWMTAVSSKRKKINKDSYNTSTALTWLYNLQWKTTRRMVPSPSWITLLNQRLMVSCPLLCIGNLHMWTNTCSGTATIISKPNIVPLVLLLIWPKLYVTILSFSKKKCIISGRLWPIVNIPNGLWTRWQKGLHVFLGGQW